MYEFITYGRYVKATAIDPVTKLEASAICVRGMTVPAMQRMANRRLEKLIFQKTLQNKQDNDFNNSTKNDNNDIII